MIRIPLLGVLLLAVQAPAWALSPQTTPVSSVVITREVHTQLDGHFNLVDQDDREASDLDFRSTPLLIYFGYTNCPDTCPLDAQTISATVDMLDVRGQRVTPIFVTVDPERDTPSRLKTFLAAFHPRFVGLTGAGAEIRRVTAAYGAEDDRINEKPSGEYDMLHPAIAYLMGRNGKFLDLIRLNNDPETVAKTIEISLKGDH